MPSTLNSMMNFAALVWHEMLFATFKEARKQRGFDVTDRIDLQWAANGEVAEAIAAHATEIAEEVLAASFDQVAELAKQDGTSLA